jgi:predicted component of type VI protein secretion system
MIDSRKENIAELAELIEYDRKELADLEATASDENKFMKLIEDLSEQDSENLKVKYE